MIAPSSIITILFITAPLMFATPPSIFPSTTNQINLLMHNPNVLSNLISHQFPTIRHRSLNENSSLEALEKLSKVFRRPQLHIEKLTTCSEKIRDVKTSSNVIPSRNRYGRPYISGRPLLTCDRLKIVECFKKGMKKIHIAKQLGITHSCVSKVLRRYAETGEVVAKACRTASCSCPGSSEEHDSRYCRHLQEKVVKTLRLFYSIENILREENSDLLKIVYYSKNPTE